MITNLSNECKTCHKLFLTVKSEVKRGGGKYCSQICYHKQPISSDTRKKLSDSKKISMIGNKNIGSGENHPNWIKDRSTIKGRDSRPFHSSEYTYWAKSVKIRDNFKCKIANGDCNGRLEIHHILAWRDHPKLRYEVNNGITLCHHHHPRKRTEEARLSPFFQSLVNKELSK